LHLKLEFKDYYQRLDVAEIEGDLLKAVVSRNLEKIVSKYTKLIESQNVLNKTVTDELN